MTVAAVRPIFRQFVELKSFTYTYLLACENTGQAVIIDPVKETVERDTKIIKELGLDLRYGINTHVHADHVTGTGKLKLEFPKMESILSFRSGGKADRLVKDGDKILFGEKCLEVRCTPGHTDGCTTFVWHEQRCAFTGDALLVRSNGRTDFQQGKAEALYDSVKSKILSLPDDYNLYIGHNYHGILQTSVGEEKRHSPRFTLSKEKFVEFMKNLKLEKPKQIDIAIPRNMNDGEG